MQFEFERRGTGQFYSLAGLKGQRGANHVRADGQFACLQVQQADQGDAGRAPVIEQFIHGGADGTAAHQYIVDQHQVLESSGQPLLDQAAQRIVRLAAPFAPFTGDLNDVDRLEIIRTWKFAKGDRLSSN